MAHKTGPARLVDYFVVVGLGDALVPFRGEPENSEEVDGNVLTGFEVVVGDLKGRSAHEDSNDAYVDLDVMQKVRLRCIRGGDGDPVTDLLFMYLDKNMHVPEGFTVVPIIREHSDHRPAESLVEHDLTALFNAELMLNCVMLLCYRTDKRDKLLPLVDVIVIGSESSSSLSRGDGEGGSHSLYPTSQELVAPPGFTQILPAFGKHKGRYLAFKRAKNIVHTAFKAAVLDRYPLSDHAGYPLPSAVSLFCLPAGVVLSHQPYSPSFFSYVLTEQEGDRIYGASLIFYEDCTDTLDISRASVAAIMSGERIYCPKCICVLSHYPFLDGLKEFLKQMYRIHLSPSTIPIERYICNFMNEVPLPDQGHACVQYDIGHSVIAFWRPPPNSPSFVDSCCFEPLFRCLSLENVVELWQCVLMERKIIFISSHYALLTAVAEAVLAVIFPFLWTHVYIPVLPVLLMDFVQAPVPFIVGIHASLVNEMTIPSEVVRVDLDNNILQILEPLPKIPSKFGKPLLKSLSKFAKIYSPHDPWLEEVDLAFPVAIHDPEEEDTNNLFNVSEVRYAFLDYMLNLMKGYRKYLVTPDTNRPTITDSMDAFDRTGFNVNHKVGKNHPWVVALTETQLFSHFIECRSFVSSHDSELAFFDDMIDVMKKKTPPNPFKMPQFNKTVWVNQPDDTGIKPGEIYRYERFPPLQPDLYRPARAVERLVNESSSSAKRRHNSFDEMIHITNPHDWARFVLESVFKLWFMVFSSYSSLLNRVDPALLEVAFDVLNQMKTMGFKADEPTYRRIIDACGRAGLTQRSMQIFKEMKDAGIEPDSVTHGIYVKAVAEGHENKTQRRKRMSIVAPTVPAVTGLSESSARDLEDAYLCMEDDCGSCGKTLGDEEIMAGWQQSYNSYTTACCYCGNKFVPRFHVSFSDGTKRFCEFLSPLVLKKEVENLFMNKGEYVLHSSLFRQEHTVIFWNLVWYFTLVGVPLFFLEHPENQFTSNNAESTDEQLSVTSQHSVSPSTPSQASSKPVSTPSRFSFGFFGFQSPPSTPADNGRNSYDPRYSYRSSERRQTNQDNNALTAFRTVFGPLRTQRDEFYKERSLRRVVRSSPKGSLAIVLENPQADVDKDDTHVQTSIAERIHEILSPPAHKSRSHRHLLEGAVQGEELDTTEPDSPSVYIEQGVPHRSVQLQPTRADKSRHTVPSVVNSMETETAANLRHKSQQLESEGNKALTKQAKIRMLLGRERSQSPDEEIDHEIDQLSSELSSLDSKLSSRRSTRRL
eukprot:GILK01006171.1.p1 GENE.GILK01006171.1~~GILK01006171.1.p1  ORF type:complete len:1268 (-),score=219.43 GILK01006171.1:106-3909(-)